MYFAVFWRNTAILGPVIPSSPVSSHSTVRPTIFLMLRRNLVSPVQSSTPYVLLHILPGWTGESPEELDHYLTAVPIKSSQTAESQQVFSISDNEQQHGVDPSSN